MDDIFVLHLIRHFPTAGNAAKQYIGWTDEAILPVDANAVSHVPDVWGSDLERCRQTAAVLFPDAAYHANPDWRECHFGDWEQQTYAQLEHDRKYRNWIEDPLQCTPPGGESLTAMARRIDRAVAALPTGNEFTVVTHGGPIRYLLAKATGGQFRQQTALHGFCHTLLWQNRQAFEEGSYCISSSAEPLTANANL